MTLVYLARHGRTSLNAAGALRGRSEVPLDEVGMREAEHLGRVLGNEGIRLVVSSPLRRAVETARPVALRAGLDVHLDERLADRDYGEWAGVGVDEVVVRFGSVDDAPGVEPRSAVVERAMAGLLDAARAGDAAGGPAVVVSHDVVNRLLLAAMTSALGGPDGIPQETGCYNTVERVLDGAGAPAGWRVLAVNQLPAGDGPAPASPAAGG